MAVMVRYTDYDRQLTNREIYKVICLRRTL